MAAIFEFSGGTITIHPCIADRMRLLKEVTVCDKVILSGADLERVRSKYPEMKLPDRAIKLTIEGADAQKIAEGWGREE